MTAYRYMDRVEDIVGTVLEYRSAPEDVVEFDCALGMMEIDGCDHMVPSLNIFVTLDCPELEAIGKLKSTGMISLPIEMTDDESLEHVANLMWDNLVVQRLELMLTDDSPRS